jgi:hypothetical protein
MDKKNQTVSLPELIYHSTMIEREIAENGGELTPSLEEALNTVDIAVAGKVDGYDFIINRGLSAAEYYQSQADTYARLAKAQKSFCDRLKEKLKTTMIETKTGEIKGNRVRYKLVKRAPKLVFDSTALPEAYMTQVTTVVPNKELITALLKDGMTVPGAHLEEVHALMKYTSRTENE